MGVGLPINLVALGFDLGLTVVLNLILGTLAWGYIWPPPIMQQLLGGLLVIEIGPGY